MHASGCNAFGNYVYKREISMLFKTEPNKAGTQSDLFHSKFFCLFVSFSNQVIWDRRSVALGITCSDPSLHTHTFSFLTCTPLYDGDLSKIAKG